MLLLLSAVLQQGTVPRQLAAHDGEPAMELVVDCAAYIGPTSWESTGDGFRDAQRALKYNHFVSSEARRWHRALNKRGIARPYGVVEREIKKQLSACGVEPPP